MVMAHPFCLDKVKSVAKKLQIPVLTFGAGDSSLLSLDSL